LEQDLEDADSINGGTGILGGDDQSAKSNNIPYICVPNVSDTVLLEKSLDLSIGSSNYNIRTSKFGVSRIYTSNSDAFRVAVKTLTTLNCQFWHHKLK